MHNVNRNRANVQEQALRRHDSSWIDGSYRGADSRGGPMQDIDFNHATCAELAQIEGIDEAAAKAIIEQRKLYGHFLSWDDVQRRVPGLDAAQLHGLQLSARIGSPRISS